jgi:hypothetical protein
MISVSRWTFGVEARKAGNEGAREEWGKGNETEGDR